MRRPIRVACLAGALMLVTGPAALLTDYFLDSPAEADAAIAVAYTLDELVEKTPMVVIGKATERHSVWEKVGGSKRIVTYTKLEIEEKVYGGGKDEIWVRTLGGVVGKIGQAVAGEAHFTIGKSSMVFVTKTKGGTHVVSGAAQGHYPIHVPKDKKKARKLMLSPRRGKIVKRHKDKQSIQEALGGVQVATGVTKVKSAKARVDGKK